LKSRLTQPIVTTRSTNNILEGDRVTNIVRVESNNFEKVRDDWPVYDTALPDAGSASHYPIYLGGAVNGSCSDPQDSERANRAVKPWVCSEGSTQRRTSNDRISATSSVLAKGAH
jgi:hypothetical protein